MLLFHFSEMCPFPAKGDEQNSKCDIATDTKDTAFTEKEEGVRGWSLFSSVHVEAGI